MKRLTATEKSAVALGILFIAVGVFAVFRPVEVTVPHAGPYRYQVLLGPNQPEHVSRRGSRIYGGVGVLAGGGIIWLALYRGRR